MMRFKYLSFNCGINIISVVYLGPESYGRIITSRPQLPPTSLLWPNLLQTGFLLGQLYSLQLSPMRSRLEITVFPHTPSLHSKLISGTTFGGNPLATRLAHHVFSRLSAPEMLTQIASTSSVFQSQIKKFQESFPNLVDSMRGRGLILGIQLKSTADKSSSDIANLVVKSAREKGLLIITAGEGTIRLVPPLNIPEDAASQGLAILE